jgi:hypothetical protein
MHAPECCGVQSDAVPIASNVRAVADTEAARTITRGKPNGTVARGYHQPHLIRLILSLQVGQVVVPITRIHVQQHRVVLWGKHTGTCVCCHRTPTCMKRVGGTGLRSRASGAWTRLSSPPLRILQVLFQGLAVCSGVFGLPQQHTQHEADVPRGWLDGCVSGYPAQRKPWRFSHLPLASSVGLA